MFVPTRKQPLEVKNTNTKRLQHGALGVKHTYVLVNVLSFFTSGQISGTK